MSKIRAAVVGVGSMGKHHARIFSKHPQVEMVAVADTRETIGQSVAHASRCAWVSDYNDLIGKVDVVSIAVPTIYHHAVASRFLKEGVHVLLEKPITATVEEAGDLVGIARENKAVLHVGHIERFNAAIRRYHEICLSPVFIEAHRLGPYDPRVKDIGVVMDLMIHDLDIVLSLVRSRVKSLEAVGCPILSDQVDIANARLHFENGCIANLTASRITPNKKRKIRIFQNGAYVSIDYDKPAMETYRLEPDPDALPGNPQFKIIRKRERLKKEDKLEAEIDYFLSCVEDGRAAEAGVEYAQGALDLAVRITNMIKEDYDGRAAVLDYRG